MNTQKYGIGNCGLFREADRTMYRNKDTVSKSCIHRERSHLNYNLCPHPQYTAAQVRERNEKIRGKKLAKNAIAWGGTVITQPKDYEGDTLDFFREAYDGLKELYGLRDEDVISAYVHLDEDAEPHMHCYFIPVAHGREKDTINWNKVMPKWKYDQQHQILQRRLTERLQTPVNLLNGKTLGFDVQKLSPEEKRLSMQVEKLKGQAEQAQEGLVNVQIATADAQETLAGQQEKIRQQTETLQQQEAKIKQQTARQEKQRAKQEGELKKLNAEIGEKYAELRDLGRQKSALAREIKRDEGKMEFLQEKINIRNRTLEGVENDIAEKKIMLEDLERESDKLLSKIDKMVKAKNGLNRSLNVSYRVTENQRNKIEIKRDITEGKVDKVLKKPLDGIAALMEAEEAVERAAHTFGRLKSAAKGDAEALADLDSDGFDRD